MMMEVGAMFAALAAATWLCVTIWGAYFVYNVTEIVSLLKRSEVIFVSKVGQGSEVSIFNQTEVDGGITFSARQARGESSNKDSPVSSSNERYWDS